MSGFILKRFKISGLNSVHTADIVFTDNKLILVGENGAGKSTILTMLYYTLSRQWEKLNEFEFDDISIEFNEEVLHFTSAELQYFLESSTRPGTSRTTYEVARLIKLSEYSVENLLDDETKLRDAFQAIRKRVPLSETRFKSLLFEIFNAEQNLLTKSVTQFDRALAQEDVRFIYLPTYRRIERDLNTLFPGVDISSRREQDALYGSKSNRIELVQFGMEDVEKLIFNSMNQLRINFQSDVNDLFGEYLRDMLRGNYKQVSTDSLHKIDSSSLDLILRRLDERTLPAWDRQLLLSKVTAFRSGSLEDIGDKVIAHFLIKLNDLQEAQSEREQTFRNFVDLCNSYLTNKEIKFDLITFAVKIELLQEKGNGRVIELADLSSGEKQVVSLFAHMAMGSAKNQFLLIDEPELSLSVPWQMRFLSDISTFNTCCGLLAVTHSPFIYDNELAPYARGINEFIQ